jgi:phosphohistidine phosphatase
MELLIVRHGIAVDRGAGGFSEEERPLTDEGTKKFKVAAAGLVRLLPAPGVILSSPLVRARQTAEIAARAWGGPSVTLVPALAGGSPPEILAALKPHRHHERVAIFGHEPDVSTLAAHLLGTRESDRLAFKKGGAALLEVGGPSAAQLVWFVSQKVLRLLGE